MYKYKFQKLQVINEYSSFIYL